MHTKAQEFKSVGSPSSDSLDSFAFRESDLVEALLKSLRLAREEYRIRIGLEQSLEILEGVPDSVVMCILPVGADNKDALSHMQLLLIEAYCHENNIRMLKLVCQDDLWNAINMKSEEYMEEFAEEANQDVPNDDVDDSLVLIQASTKLNHIEDEELRKFYDLAALHYHARPIVRLRS